MDESGVEAEVMDEAVEGTADCLPGPVQELSAESERAIFYWINFSNPRTLPCLLSSLPNKKRGNEFNFDILIF